MTDRPRQVRLDPDVVAALASWGPSIAASANAALRSALGLAAPPPPPGAARAGPDATVATRAADGPAPPNRPLAPAARAAARLTQPGEPQPEPAPARSRPRPGATARAARGRVVGRAGSRRFG